MKSVSVITVVRNNERTIEHCLQSVANQSHPNVEHIVLDGQSTDATFKLIQDFAKHHPNVKAFSQADEGMYDALNKGIGMASHEVIAFLHSDDVYAHDDVLKEACLNIQDVDAVYSDLVYVKADDVHQVVRYWRSKAFKPGLFTYGWCPPHPTLMIKRAKYEQLGGFDISLPIGNDVELMMRFFEKHHLNARYCPKVWVKMRMGGISNRSIKNIYRQNQVIAKSFKKNQLPFSWAKFVTGKLISRASQFIKKPELV